MRKTYEMYRYFQWVEILGERITNVSCSCPDFVFRRLKDKDGKIYAISMCKHLTKIVGMWHKNKEIKLRDNLNEKKSGNEIRS